MDYELEYFREETAHLRDLCAKKTRRIDAMSRQIRERDEVIRILRAVVSDRPTLPATTSGIAPQAPGPRT